MRGNEAADELARQSSSRSFVGACPSSSIKSPKITRPKTGKTIHRIIEFTNPVIEVSMYNIGLAEDTTYRFCHEKGKTPIQILTKSMVLAKPLCWLS